jgi:hypothetical protein
MLQDLGYPSNTKASRLVINPPSPPMPVFVKPFYVGHLYKNRTFVMEENPELEEGTTYYSTSFEGILSPLHRQLNKNYLKIGFRSI